MSKDVMKVEGMAELMGKILEIPTRMNKGAIARIMTEAAEPIVFSAKAKMRKHKRTGALEEKIQADKPRVNGNATYVHIIVPRGEGVAYAIPLEYGHINPDGSITPPYPFMLPAYVEGKDAAYQTIKDGLRGLVAGGGA